MDLLRGKHSVSRRSVVLNDDTDWMVARYLLLLGAPGLIFGFVWNSLILVMVASILLGLYAAPLAPIWKKASTPKDDKFLQLMKAGPGKHFRIWFWVFPAVISLFLVLGVIGHLFGWEVASSASTSDTPF